MTDDEGLEGVLDSKGIADQLGVERRTIYQWRHRHSDFPKPVRVFGGRPVWRWSEVAQWARDTGRLTTGED